MIDRIQVKVTASGSAGSASGSAHSPPVHGRVLKVALAYGGSPPATTDVTLQDEADPQSENIVNLADANTDLALYPRRSVQDNTNTDLTFDGTHKVCAPYVVHGRLTLAVAGADDGDTITATVWIET
jgi:hypothetical protein